MSYATMQDLLFALHLTDSELPDRLTAEPELPEERSELRGVQPTRGTDPCRRSGCWRSSSNSRSAVGTGRMARAPLPNSLRHDRTDGSANPTVAR